MLIRDGVHSGLCPFGMVSIRDGVHSGLCLWDCVHSGNCPDPGKNNLDNYLLQFGRYATVGGWQLDTWAVCFSLLLTSKALFVYSGISSEVARDCNKLLRALLQKYNFTEQGYREKFRSAEREGQELSDQLIVRIRNYFNRWVELAEVSKTFEVVEKFNGLRIINQFVSEGCVNILERVKP